MLREINKHYRVTALISVGQHPESGRARRAEQDARAVEMGMTLSPTGLEVLHAGNPEDQALRSYAGMGLSTLRVLSIAEQGDAAAVLSHYLKQQTPQVILTGGRAERGESSGMLPFCWRSRWASRWWPAWHKLLA